MADDPLSFGLFVSVLVVVSLTFCTASTDVEYSTSKPCTYFGGTRVSLPMGNLVNCSWYAGNACCKRTEVTSVFGSMYPLYGASKVCRNHINYMMCYFCSPDQYKWYTGRVRVCADFCNAVYDHCKLASYHGKTIGEAYTTGQEFCEGQRFDVKEGKGNCFDFDPTVFGDATTARLSNICFVLISIILLLTTNMYMML